MDGSQLTAALRLTLKDEASGGVKALDEVFGRLNATLDQLATALAPLAALGEALSATTAGTARLDEALSASAGAASRMSEATRGASMAAEAMGTAFGSAAWQVSELNVTLRELGSAETLAGSTGEAMGAEIAAGAGQALGVVDTLLARMRALREGMATAGGAMMNGPVGAWAGDVREAGRGFAGSLQGSMHHAMTAGLSTMAMLEPIHAYADYGNALTHIGLTLGLHGQANADYSANLGRQIDAWSRQYGQRGTDMVEAATFLNQEGYSQERMNALVPVIGQISTAYNAHPDAVARTAFALNQNLGVSTQDTNVGLAMLARVGKMSALPFEELAPLFPELASSAAGVGVKGLDQVADLGGMLALIRKNTGTSGEATTALRAFIQTISSPHARHRFDKYGIDLNRTVLNAQHHNADPLAAVLDSVMAIGDSDKRYTAIGDLFGNERDQLFTRAMTRDWKQYTGMRDEVHKTSASMIGEDYDTARKNSPLTHLNAFEESLSQLNRRVGKGFVPVMNIMTRALNGVNTGFEWLDKHVPGVTSGIITLMGGVLGLTAGAAALGVVWGPVRAGFTMLGTVLAPVERFLGLTAARTALVRGGLVLLRAALSPIPRLIGLLGTGLSAFLALPTGAIVAIVAGFVAVGAAVADVVMHWDRFSAAFHQIGQGHVLAGGLAVLRQLFTDFGGWLDGWTHGLPSRMLAGLASEWHVLTDGLSAQVGKLEQAFDTSWIGRHMGLAAPVPAGVAAPVPTMAGAAAAQQGAQGGRYAVHITTDRGVTARQVSGPQQGLTIASPNTGRTVGRP